jgi:hypothetical protein
VWSTGILGPRNTPIGRTAGIAAKSRTGIGNNDSETGTAAMVAMEPNGSARE